MKRFLLIVMCFLFLFALAGCRSQNSDAVFPSEPTDPGVTLQSGAYYMVGDFKEGLTPSVWLDLEDNSFVLSPGTYMSYAEVGSFETKDGKLIATTQDATYTFEIKDAKTLRLIDCGGRELSIVPESAEFVFREDTP